MLASPEMRPITALLKARHQTVNQLSRPSPWAPSDDIVLVLVVEHLFFSLFFLHLGSF